MRIGGFNKMDVKGFLAWGCNVRIAMHNFKIIASYNVSIRVCRLPIVRLNVMYRIGSFLNILPSSSEVWSSFPDFMHACMHAQPQYNCIYACLFFSTCLFLVRSIWTKLQVSLSQTVFCTYDLHKILCTSITLTKTRNSCINPDWLRLEWMEDTSKQIKWHFL